MTADANKTAATDSAATPQNTAPHRYVVDTRELTESYADGIARAMIERGVLKMDLFSVVGFDQEKKEEVRAISRRLVLPLTAVQELAQVLQGISEMAQKQQAAQQQQQQPAS